MAAHGSKLLCPRWGMLLHERMKHTKQRITKWPSRPCDERPRRSGHSNALPTLELAGLLNLQGIGKRVKLLDGGRFSMGCVHVAPVSYTATNTNAAPSRTSTLVLPSTSLTSCWWMPMENQLPTLSRRSCSAIVPNSLREKHRKCSGMR